MLRDGDILLIVEKSIRSAIVYAIHRNAKTHNKYMKDYDASTDLSHPIYWNANDLLG